MYSPQNQQDPHGYTQLASSQAVGGGRNVAISTAGDGSRRAAALRSSPVTVPVQVPPGAVAGYMLPDGRFVAAQNVGEVFEAPFRLESDPMTCACASLVCNVCAGCCAVYLAHEANSQAMWGRRAFALETAARSRRWAELAVMIGIVCAITATCLYIVLRK